jgi:methyl-accepting chemotaxis protein
MKKEQPGLNKLLASASLSSQGSRLQLGVAIALISIVPNLTLYYMFQSYTAGTHLSAWQMWGVGAILVGTICMGYSLLFKYPRAVMRLRSHMERLARGELPENIDLMDEESDISAIETYFNLIIDTMKNRIMTIEKQGSQIMATERQRVMIESLCTACHCLGQPATVIACYLELLKKELLSQSGSDYLMKCNDEVDKLRASLSELQSITEYKTEAYCDSGDEAADATQKIIQTPSDKALSAESLRQQVIR